MNGDLRGLIIMARQAVSVIKMSYYKYYDK